MANVKQAKLDFIKGYGENYRKLRKSKGLTLEELGKIIHYSDKTINNIETEQRTPTIEQLKAYHYKFGVSYEYLLGETDVTDMSLQSVCEFTGLSEEAVNTLHDLKNSSVDDDLLKVIEYLLSDYDLQCNAGTERICSLLGLIWEYLFAEYVLPDNNQHIEYRVKGYGDSFRFDILRIKELLQTEIVQKLNTAKSEIDKERNNK